MAVSLFAMATATLILFLDVVFDGIEERNRQFLFTLSVFKRN